MEVIQVGRYHFLQFELGKDNVYVLEESNYFRQEEVDTIKEILEMQGFQAEDYQNFLIYTYPE